MNSLADAVPWDTLAAMEPLDRARAAAELLDAVPDVQARLRAVRSDAVAQLREQYGSSAAVAEALGISAARVGQIMDGPGRPDGIRLDLLKRGLLLAMEHGTVALGDDRKVSQALEVLGRSRISETEARGVATRLAGITASAVDTGRMTAEEKRVWRRAVAHAMENTHSARRG